MLSSERNIMRQTLVFFVIAVPFVFGATADAHHSFAATYQQSKVIKLEGKVVQFLFRNPHSFIHIEAPDEKGQMHRWAIEWGGAGQLIRQGVSAEVLKVGDVVVINGGAARNPDSRRLLMINISRPADGFEWGRRTGEVVD
jgi:hypothetical protein